MMTAATANTLNAAFSLMTEIKTTAEDRALIAPIFTCNERDAAFQAVSSYNAHKYRPTIRGNGKEADIRAAYKRILADALQEAIAWRIADTDDGAVRFWLAELQRQMTKLADVPLAEVRQARKEATDGTAILTAERDALAARLRVLEAAERGQKRREAAGEAWERAEALERERDEWRSRCLRLEAERDLLTRQTAKAEAELAEAAPWTDAPFWTDEP